MLFRGLLFSVFTVIISLSHFDSIAQVDLKNLLDSKVDSKKEQAEQAKKKDASIKVLQDSLKILTTKASDTLKTEESFGEIEKVVPFDTLEFQSRNVAVKARKPKFNFSNEEDWQKEFLLTNNKTYKKKHQLDSSKQIFGWHPYWMGNAYKSYNFSLLSVIAYFSYELDPSTGSYRSIHEWKTTSMIDSAHAHGCKVVLSVTNFGMVNNSKFLSNIGAQKTFINTLITLLRERNADGVNIDFEAIPRSSRAALTNFLIDLSSSLRAARADYLITIALPAVDFDHVYELNQLSQFVDLFVIMGYEFYGANSKVAGPIAPITSGNTWWPYNLERAVDEYLISGVPPSKLLLGLPYYGAEWQTKDLKFPSKVEKFIGYSMYRSIKKDHGELLCCNDDVSGGKFHVYRDGMNKYRQIWFEDKISLARKYDWINEKKIGGIGIWALGYDNGHTELWELLAQKFALPDSVAKPVHEATVHKRGGMSWQRMLNFGLRIMRNPQSLVTNPRPLLMIFGPLLGISLAGIFVFMRYGYRFKRIWKVLFQGVLSLVILIILALIFFTLKYAGLREVAFLLGGFIIAGLLFLIFSRQFLIDRDLP